MRSIKPFLIGVSSAGISILGSLFRNPPANVCSGACRACGGVCLQPLLMLPAVGVFALMIGKIRGHKFLSKPWISRYAKRNKMQVWGGK